MLAFLWKSNVIWSESLPSSVLDVVHAYFPYNPNGYLYILRDETMPRLIGNGL